MQIIPGIFDYMYYRITKIYLKWDGSVGYTAIWAVSMVQALFFSEILISIVKLFYDKNEISKHAKSFGIGSAIILIIIGFINFKRYKNKYIEYELKWSREGHLKHRLLGFAILVGLVLPWIILFYI
jgi:hypothetical protein